MLRLRIEYSSKSHIPPLDNLRGLAVLLVMLFHCFYYDVFKFGWAGVDMFFVLSGFLITGILLDSRTAPYYYKNFIARRLLRIFPLYYFVLLICFVMVPTSFFGAGFEYYRDNQLWFWFYIQNWLYSRTGFPENHSLVHLWSLAVEEQFYIFWPLIVRLFNEKRLFIFCLIIVLFSNAFRLSWGAQLGLVHPYDYMATLSRMDALIVGAVIAILIRKRIAWLEKFTYPVFLVSSFILLFFVFLKKSFLFTHLAPAFTFIDIIFGCLLLFMLNRERFMLLRPFYHPVFSFLGKYSYGLYIYHYLIYNFFKYSIVPEFSAAVGGENIALFLSGMLTFVISIPISVLSYKYLESPFLRLKKFFANKEKELIQKN